jgi:nucleoside-diphosphate-sugar epimerase
MTDALAGRRVAIIGGAGFIGHNLALRLSALGAKVSVVDSLQINNILGLVPGLPGAPNIELDRRILQQRLDLLQQSGVPVYIQDARDYHALGRVLENQIAPQVIVHLAAVAHAGRSNKDPWSTFDHSLRTLENALDSARGRVEHFVYLSSSMAYGNFQSESVDEDHPLNPIGIYGALKVAGEKIVIAYQQVFGLEYTIIRPSALYGPRCVSRRVVQTFIENALQGRPLRVQGDGSERLDFTYIDDLVEGICLALRLPAARNQAFNLTFGRSRSIQELLALVLQESPGVPVSYVGREEGVPIRGTLSIQKAARLLGYVPATPLERGLEQYVGWYRQILGGGIRRAGADRPEAPEGEVRSTASRE